MLEWETGLASRALLLSSLKGARETDFAPRMLMLRDLIYEHSRLSRPSSLQSFHLNGLHRSLFFSLLLNGLDLNVCVITIREECLGDLAVADGFHDLG